MYVCVRACMCVCVYVCVFVFVCMHRTVFPNKIVCFINLFIIINYILRL